jgi:DNA-binding response OmpR family regulator
LLFASDATRLRGIETIEIYVARKLNALFMDTGSARKILIIEDESDVADLLEMGLRKSGFTTLVAADGAIGLQKARDNRPDFIILDLMLPKMSGLEVCRILKGDAATSHIPILMLTAKAEEIDRIVGLEFGADDYVTKPFSPREVTLWSSALTIT